MKLIQQFIIKEIVVVLVFIITLNCIKVSKAMAQTANLVYYEPYKYNGILSK